MERGQGLVYAVKGHLKSTSKPVRLLFQSLYFIFDVWLFIMDSEAYSQTDYFFYNRNNKYIFIIDDCQYIDCLGK